jgi:hypothetical protein
MRQATSREGPYWHCTDLTLAEPLGEATHWNGRAMAKASGVSLRSVQRIWEAHQLQPYRLRTWHGGDQNTL